MQAKKSLNTFSIKMVCGQDNLAGEKVFEYFRDNDDMCLRQICRRKNFECFQDNDDLHLRQYCRRNNFLKISGEWWFASKTILQAKKSLNISKIMMICVQDNFAGEKVFDYFQDNVDLRPRQSCGRKSLWIFSG